jgi:hypothetical protein
VIQTVAVVVVLAALGCAVLVGLYVVPFVLAVDMGERRGFSTFRVGVGCLLVAAVSLLLAFAGRHTHLLLLPAVLLAWAGPAVLSLVASSQTRFGGREGVHEH